jgi:Fe-S cluster assembly iron-binding protein IscA
MIYVTERAKEELKKLLTISVDWPGACLRLIDRGQGKLGLGVDIRMNDDQLVEYEGKTLLLVDPELASGLQLITLDVDDTDKGPELVISESKEEEPAVTEQVTSSPEVPVA